MKKMHSFMKKGYVIPSCLLILSLSFISVGFFFGFWEKFIGIVAPETADICGNEICEESETIENCPEDCGSLHPTESSGEKDSPEKIEFDVTDCFDVGDGMLWSPIIDGKEFRFGGVDTNSVYWKLSLLPILDQTLYEGDHFEFRGEYPHAVYASFHLCAEDTTFIDKITDYEILPDTNSVNPFVGDNPYTKGNNYTIEIWDLENQVEIPGKNILYGGFVDGIPIEENVIMLRVYEPLTGRDGGVELPRIYFVSDEPNNNTPKSKEEVCTLFDPIKSAKIGFATMFKIEEKVLDPLAIKMAENTNQPTRCYTPADPIEWIIGINYFGMMNSAFEIIPDSLITDEATGANMDTRYLAGFFDSTNELTIARFKPPVIDKQVRYWSVCVYQPLNALLYGWACAKYNELQVDEDGYITVIYSSPEHKPLGVCDPVNGVTNDCQYNWMHYGSNTPLSWIRQLVSNDNYKESLINYKGDNYDAEAIKKHMGEYYPQTWYCSKADFEQYGLGCGEVTVCGDGKCEGEETAENCPEDCRVMTEFELTCKSTYTTEWHEGECHECKAGYNLVECEEKGLWIFKKAREVCEKVYETECLENPKCEQGDEETGREECGE